MIDLKARTTDLWKTDPALSIIVKWGLQIQKVGEGCRLLATLASIPMASAWPLLETGCRTKWTSGLIQLRYSDVLTVKTVLCLTHHCFLLKFNNSPLVLSKYRQYFMLWAKEWTQGCLSKEVWIRKSRKFNSHYAVIHNAQLNIRFTDRINNFTAIMWFSNLLIGKSQQTKLNFDIKVSGEDLLTKGLSHTTHCLEVLIESFNPPEAGPTV